MLSVIVRSHWDVEQTNGCHLCYQNNGTYTMQTCIIYESSTKIYIYINPKRYWTKNLIDCISAYNSVEDIILCISFECYHQFRIIGNQFLPSDPHIGQINHVKRCLIMWSNCWSSSRGSCQPFVNMPEVNIFSSRVFLVAIKYESVG